MTAPDPGLTADHTFQSGGGGDGYTEPFCFGAECSCGEVYESWVQSADDDEGHDFDLDRLADLHAAHVALVVEQHTNGRTAELEATIARVEKALAEGPLHRIDFPSSKDPYGIERQMIRAALEGEQQ